jgi:LacI family transcriptional regulator
MLALLDLPAPPTAVFTTNNLMTLGALGALQSRQVAVPDDLAIVGFDDFEWAAVLRPRVTAVAQPTYRIGEMATRMLIERIEGRAPPEPRRVVLPTRLIVRQSSGAGGDIQSAEFEDVFGRPPVHVADVQLSAR